MSALNKKTAFGIGVGILTVFVILGVLISTRQIVLAPSVDPFIKLGFESPDKAGGSNFSGDFTGKVSGVSLPSFQDYDGPVDSDLDDCMDEQEDRREENSYEDQQIYAEYSEDFPDDYDIDLDDIDVTALKGKIRDDIGDVFGYSVRKNELHWDWHGDEKSYDYEKSYIFESYSGDEAFWYCYFNATDSKGGSEFFTDFFVEDSVDFVCKEMDEVQNLEVAIDSTSIVSTTSTKYTIGTEWDEVTDAVQYLLSYYPEGDSDEAQYVLTDDVEATLVITAAPGTDYVFEVTALAEKLVDEYGDEVSETGDFADIEDIIREGCASELDEDESQVTLKLGTTAKSLDLGVTTTPVIALTESYKVGNTLVFTATATGGSSSYTYSFVLKNENNNTILAQTSGFVNNNVFSYTLLAAEKNKQLSLKVIVKDGAGATKTVDRAYSVGSEGTVVDGENVTISSFSLGTSNNCAEQTGGTIKCSLGGTATLNVVAAKNTTAIAASKIYYRYSIYSAQESSGSWTAWSETASYTLTANTLGNYIVEVEAVAAESIPTGDQANSINDIKILSVSPVVTTNCYDGKISSPVASYDATSKGVTLTWTGNTTSNYAIRYYNTQSTEVLANILSGSTYVVADNAAIKTMAASTTALKALTLTDADLTSTGDYVFEVYPIATASTSYTDADLHTATTANCHIAVTTNVAG